METQWRAVRAQKSLKTEENAVEDILASRFVAAK
jgi:hypothetical protein